MDGLLIGYGTIAQGHLAGYAYQPELDLRAILDVSPRRRAAACHDHPEVAVVRSVAELDGLSIDFVDICSPPSTHQDYILTALRRGWHVLCEKPLVARPEELESVRAAALTRGSVLFPAQNYLFSPAFALVRELLHDELDIHGRGLRARFRTERPGHARGVTEWRPDWRRDARIAGGGILTDHGPHAIYLSCELLADAPAEVRCRIRHDHGPRTVATEHEASLELVFANAHVDVELTWCADSRRTRYDFWNSAGTVAWDGDVVELQTQSGRRTWRTGSSFDDRQHGSWFGPLLGEAADAWSTGDRTSHRLLQAMTTIEVISAAYTSARQQGSWQRPLPSGSTAPSLPHAD